MNAATTNASRAIYQPLPFTVAITEVGLALCPITEVGSLGDNTERVRELGPDNLLDLVPVLEKGSSSCHRIC